MDQSALVGLNIEGGAELIRALTNHDFPVGVAFWARMTDEEDWTLFLASPKIDLLGKREAYSLVYGMLLHNPEWDLHPFSVQLLERGNSMAEAAAEYVRPKNGSRPSIGRPRVYTDSYLGRFAVNGAFIYPPLEPAAPTAVSS